MFFSTYEVVLQVELAELMPLDPVVIEPRRKKQAAAATEERKEAMVTKEQDAPAPTPTSMSARKEAREAAAAVGADVLRCVHFQIVTRR